MFNFRRTANTMDTSLFDPEQDMDLVSLINNARSEAEIHSVTRMSNARMRARRSELNAARRPARSGSAWARGFAPPSSTMRGF